MSTRGKLSNLSAAVLLVTTQGCIKAPPIAVVDTRTALEIQASGEYPELEFEAADAALQPGPIPMSGKDIISQSGLAAAGHDLDLFAATLSDTQLIDSMLLLGCLGEGEDGLLKYTPERCEEDVQVSELLSTASRANLHRRQVWEYLASRRPDRSTASARDAWRSVHLEQVRCGAWIEKDGTWSKKAC